MIDKNSPRLALETSEDKVKKVAKIIDEINRLEGIATGPADPEQVKACRFAIRRCYEILKGMGYG